MVDVLTNRYNQFRTGANLDEPFLNQRNVNVNEFGKLFSRGVDGQIYAQPLIVADLKLPRSGSRSLVFVATTRNMVYAFDAESREACHPIWRANLNGPNASPVPRSDYSGAYRDFTAEIGITSTPVIDLKSSTIYLTSKTRQYKRNKPHYLYKLHALDIRTGKKTMGPTVIAETAVNDPENLQNSIDFRFVQGPLAEGDGLGNINGTVYFNAFFQLQRTGLLLCNGALYMGFGSQGDYGEYHGWILSFDCKSLSLIASYCTTPDWGEGGVWQSGCGLAADEAGCVYAVCGNGSAYFRGKHDPGSDRLLAGPFFGQSVLKLRLNRKARKFELVDWFTAGDILDNNQLDDDLCAGPVLLPWKDLLGAWGKDRAYYVMDRNDLGKYTAKNTGIIQYAPGMTEPLNGAATGHIHGAPVVFSDPTIGPVSYVWAENDRLRGYPFDLNNSRFVIKPPVELLSNDVLHKGMPGGMLAISCNGSDPERAKGTAIVWALHPVSGDANDGTVAGMLQAYRADNLNNPIWSSNHDPLGADDLGDFAKFCPPVVANGKVYVATSSQQLIVYGLLQKHPHSTSLGSWSQTHIPVQTSDSDDRTFQVLGTASYSCHRFTIVGAGADIWGKADACHYVYKTASDGPITFTARVINVLNTNDWAKAGLMIRNGLDVGSVHAMMSATATQGAQFLYRKNMDNETAGVMFGQGGPPPYWLRIKRTPLGGSHFEFSGFTSMDGETWDQVGGSISIEMGRTCYVGMAITAHVGEGGDPLQDLCTAVLDRLTLEL